MLVLGPDSSLAPLIGAAIVPLAARVRSVRNGGWRSPGLLALLVGLVLVVGALLRLGFLTDLLSKPIRIGYLNGVALVVIVGQLPALLGFSTDGDGLVEELETWSPALRTGKFSRRRRASACAALTVILVLRLPAPLVPGFARRRRGGRDRGVWALDLAGVPVVGPLPGGLPVPGTRHLAWGRCRVARRASTRRRARRLRRHRCAVEGVRGARGHRRRPQPRDGGAGPGQCRLRRRQRVPGLGELVTHPRRPGDRGPDAARRPGGAASVGAVVAVAPGFTSYLPSSALAAVVIAAVLSVADVPATVRLLRMDPVELRSR